MPEKPHIAPADDRRIERHAVAEVPHAGVAAAEHGARRDVHAEAGHGRSSIASDEWPAKHCSRDC